MKNPLEYQSLSTTRISLVSQSMKDGSSLRNSIFQKLRLLGEVIKRKKLDTDVGKLTKDLEKILE
jgi:hypothetical protein